MKLYIVLVLGMYVGNKLPFWIAKLNSYLDRRYILKRMMPKKLDPSKMCHGPHWWLDASIYTEDGDKEAKICSACGFIQGTRTAATPEAIDRIEENIRYKAIEDKIYQEFSDKEDNDIKKFFDNELSNGMSFEKLVRLHNAGISFNRRYIEYRSSKSQEVRKELAKSNS